MGVILVKTAVAGPFANIHAVFTMNGHFLEVFTCPLHCCIGCMWVSLPVILQNCSGFCLACSGTMELPSWQLSAVPCWFGGDCNGPWLTVWCHARVTPQSWLSASEKQHSHKWNRPRAFSKPDSTMNSTGMPRPQWGCWSCNADTSQLPHHDRCCLWSVPCGNFQEGVYANKRGPWTVAAPPLDALPGRADSCGIWPMDHDSCPLGPLACVHTPWTVNSCTRVPFCQFDCTSLQSHGFINQVSTCPNLFR